MTAKIHQTTVKIVTISALRPARLRSPGSGTTQSAAAISSDRPMPTSRRSQARMSKRAPLRTEGLIKEGQHFLNVLRRHKGRVGVAGAGQQFERDLLFAQQRARAGGEVDGLLVRYGIVAVAMLDEEGRRARVQCWLPPLR